MLSQASKCGRGTDGDGCQHSSRLRETSYNTGRYVSAVLRLVNTLLFVSTGTKKSLDVFGCDEQATERSSDLRPAVGRYNGAYATKTIANAGRGTGDLFGEASVFTVLSRHETTGVVWIKKLTHSRHLHDRISTGPSPGSGGESARLVRVVRVSGRCPHGCQRERSRSPRASYPVQRRARGSGAERACKAVKSACTSMVWRPSNANTSDRYSRDYLQPHLSLRLVQPRRSIPDAREGTDVHSQYSGKQSNTP